MSKSKILIVKYDNEILGNDEKEYKKNLINTIPNMIAKALAEQVVIDGKTRTYGMWTVSLKRSGWEEEHPSECPECNAETYDTECSNINCGSCGALFTYCTECDWSTHSTCTEG